MQSGVRQGKCFENHFSGIVHHGSDTIIFTDVNANKKQSDTKLRPKAWKAEVADLTAQKDRLYSEVRKLEEVAGSRIDRKNEEIDLLKVGLSGIVKWYGFQTVHDFYEAFAAAKTAYVDYRDKSDKWEERYGKAAHRQEKESVHNRLQNYQRENADQHIK